MPSILPGMQPEQFKVVAVTIPGACPGRGVSDGTQWIWLWLGPGLLRYWALGGTHGELWAGVSGRWSAAPVCRATEELCSLGMGAMAEVGTIVDKVKEVLSQHGGSQQS